VQQFRVEERERQHALRMRRRAETPASAPAAASRHAPASPHKCLDLQEEVMSFWDSLQTASRASFQRALPQILRRFERSSETRAGP
jgi:hypothetical protein